MAAKKNIGLVTWFGTPNYGTSLQAYALYKALEERGCNVKIIRRFKEPFNLKNIKDNFFYAHGIRRFWKYGRDRFPAKTRGDLHRLLESTDLFVAGSDQLWNCRDHFRGFEFLEFAVGKKKISYATSIGTAEIPDEYKEKVKEYLSDFQYISLREQSGASSIAEVTGRDDIATVLDPVLLQDREFWESFSGSARQTPAMPEGYVLYYILKKVPSAASLPRDDRRKAVIIPSGENPDFTLPGATIVPDAGLREFVALVRGASLVVTDSFHGTALAIALERQFVNLKRFSDSDIASQNIRLKDLLDRLGIDDRTWQGEMPAPIDYAPVRARLEILRKESAAYLEKALAD